MRKLVAVVLVSLLLVPLMAGPAHAWRGGWHGHRGCCWGGFAVGIGVGALATAPFWYPRAYAYPAYAYPVYPYPAYPAYSYPAYGYPAYPPPPPPAPPADPGAAVQPGQSTGMSVGMPVSNPPAADSSTPATAQGCYTVTVDGHNETRILSTGETVTAWVPTHTQQVCR